MSDPSSTDGTYSLPSEFSTLFNDFTGGSEAVAVAMSTLMNSSAKVGKLIIGSNAQISVYDDQKLQGSADFRSSDTNGFYEVTAVSHIGPAIMYLAQIQSTLNANDAPSASEQPAIRDASGAPTRAFVVKKIGDMIDHIAAVQKLNAATENNWLDRLNASLAANGGVVTWKGKDANGDEISDAMRAMIDYACALATAYLQWVQGDVDTRMADLDALNQRFLLASDYTGQVGYNEVMVGTFIADGLMSVNTVSGVLASLSADDWLNARIVLQTLPGGFDDAVNAAGVQYVRGNLSAGLNAYTNWFHALFVAFAGRAGADTEKVAERIIIAPYATMLADPAPEQMSDTDWSYYTNTAWGQLYFPGQIAAQTMPASVMELDYPSFCQVTKVGVSSYAELRGSEATTTGASAKWPGDYFENDADGHFGGTVEAFMARMKHSFSASTEMLSNAVALWVGPAYVNNDCKVEGMYLPGISAVGYADAVGAINQDASS